VGRTADLNLDRSDLEHSEGAPRGDSPRLLDDGAKKQQNCPDGDQDKSDVPVDSALHARGDRPIESKTEEKPSDDACGTEIDCDADNMHATALPGSSVQDGVEPLSLEGDRERMGQASASKRSTAFCASC
jgi:hypothetical protein